MTTLTTTMINDLDAVGKRIGASAADDGRSLAFHMDVTDFVVTWTGKTWDGETSRTDTVSLGTSKSDSETLRTRSILAESQIKRVVAATVAEREATRVPRKVASMAWSEKYAHDSVARSLKEAADRLRRVADEADRLRQKMDAGAIGPVEAVTSLTNDLTSHTSNMSLGYAARDAAEAERYAAQLDALRFAGVDVDAILADRRYSVR